MQLNSVVLVTSNLKKLKEYQDMGLPFATAQGQDLPEICADPISIATYKALAAGPNCLVEDTILTIDGEEIIDIRWRVQELAKLQVKQPPVIQWVVTLGYNDGEHVRVYQGVVECDLVALNGPVPDDAFAFDPFLKPKGESRSFYQLAKAGDKQRFSPRFVAAQAFINQQEVACKRIADIKPWDGEYQTSN